MAVRQVRPRTTIADVANLAGVSISTVSRVMNDSAPVLEETQRRVQEAIQALHYSPQPAARMLAGRQTNTVGLLLPEIGGAFYGPLLRGIETELRDHGFDLLILATSHDPVQWDGRPLPLDEHNTDGLLVFTDRLTNVHIKRLHQHGFPVVLLHRSAPEGLDIPCITFENKAGTRRLVEHLIEVHGRRRIGFLGGPVGNEDTYWRALGYREALNNHGIAFDEALIGAGNFNEVDAQKAVGQWLRNGIEFDAIFAGDDDSASGVLLALRRAGKHVPTDVAVVGFDDVPSAPYLLPPLTTVRAPIQLAGQMAARQLLHLIRGQVAESFLLLPTELVIRQSCGCH